MLSWISDFVLKEDISLPPLCCKLSVPVRAPCVPSGQWGWISIPNGLTSPLQFHADAPSSSHLLLCSTKPWRSCHSPSPTVQRGQSCGFSVTTESTRRPEFILGAVLCRGHCPSQENMEKARGTSAFPPGLSLQGIEWLQACEGGICQVTQASLEPSNKFSYRINPAPATHSGLFPGSHPRSPFFHLQSAFVPCRDQSRAPDSHPTHPTAAPALPACLAHWAGRIPAGKQVEGSNPRVVMGSGCSWASPAPWDAPGLLRLCSGQGEGDSRD